MTNKKYHCWLNSIMWLKPLLHETFIAPTLRAGNKTVNRQLALAQV